MMKNKIFLMCFFLSLHFVWSQSVLKIGNNPGTINPDAAFEIESTNKGILIPRVQLVQKILPSPLSTFTNSAGMIVYNTATINDVLPGLYYSNGSSWVGVQYDDSTLVGGNIVFGNSTGTSFSSSNDLAWDNNSGLHVSKDLNLTSSTGTSEVRFTTDIYDGSHFGFAYSARNRYINSTSSIFDLTSWSDPSAQTSFIQANSTNGAITSMAFTAPFINFNGTSIFSNQYIGTASSIPTLWHPLYVDGKMQLSGGVIQRGGSVPITGTQDLGLYSCVPGNYVRIGTNNSKILFYTDLDTNGSFGNVSKMMIESNGNVGIGTDVPTLGKLQINGYATQNNANYGFLNGSGASGFVGGNQSNLRYSIWADSRIACNEFNAFSDERLKKFISYSDSKEDLTILNKIKIINYTKVDSIDDPNKYKKVFAQQLEKVFPQAVHQSKGYIPNIYKLVMADKGVVKIPNSLKKGDKVKLILEKDEMIVNVVEATKYSFKIDKEISQQVFVYGVEVDDLRNVDYDAIAMLNVSATQQLNIQIMKAEEELKILNQKRRKIEKLLNHKLMRTKKK